MVSVFKFDVAAGASIRHQAADALSRWPTTGNNHTAVRYAVSIQMMPDDTTSDDISSFLTLTDKRYGWCTKHFSADETNVFVLGWEDPANTNGSDYKHVPAIPEMLGIANSPDLSRPVTKADFISG